MLKLSKKVVLFFMLVINLFKQLVVGLTLFLYKRTLGSRWGAFICMGGVALLLLFSFMVLAPSETVATTNTINNQQDDVTTSVQQLSETVDQAEDLFALQEASEENATSETDSDKLLAKNPKTETFGVDPFSGMNVDGFSFQATEYSGGSSKTGKPEPFESKLSPAAMPGFPGGDGTMSSDASGLTPQQIAEMEAEKRRQEILANLQSDVNVKGIVNNVQGSEPMAILQFIRGDGTDVVKTVVPGDVIDLSTCQAKVVAIQQNWVELSSEKVIDRKYLPAFEDETGDSGMIPVSDITAPAGDTMSPPDSKGGTGSASIDDAKKKIEEIDKLLDSF